MRSYSLNILPKLNMTWFIAFMFFLYPAIEQYIWRVATIFVPINAGTLSSVIMIPIVVLFIVYATKHANFSCFLVFFLYILVVLFSFLFGSYEYFTSNELIRISMISFLGLLCGVSMKFDEKLYNTLYWQAVIVMFISIAYLLYYISGREMVSDNMDFSYSVMPSVLIVLAGPFYKKNKFLNILLSTIGVIFIIMNGTRGPLLCILIFYILMLYKKYGFSKVVIISMVGVILINIIWSMSVTQELLISFANSIGNMGMSPRIIEMLIENEISSGNGRDIIRESLMAEIRENPFYIRGLFADRQHTIGLYDFEHSTTYTFGAYAHNIIVELVFDFGIVLGALIFLLLLFLIIRFTLKVDYEHFAVPAIMIICGFAHLFVSGDFITSATFFLLLGAAFGVAVNKSVRKDKNEIIDKERLT